MQFRARMEKGPAGPAKNGTGRRESAGSTGEGRYVHGSGPVRFGLAFRVAIGTAAFAQHVPGDVRTQLLAEDCLALVPRRALHLRAMLRGELPIGVEPWPNVAAVVVAEDHGHGGLPAKDRRSTVECDLLRG